jgi:hypothetical protein
LFTAARHVFGSRNLTSLNAVWEDRKWIGGVLVAASPERGKFNFLFRFHG